MNVYLIKDRIISIISLTGLMKILMLMTQMNKELNIISDVSLIKI